MLLCSKRCNEKRRASETRENTGRAREWRERVGIEPTSHCEATSAILKTVRATRLVRSHMPREQFARGRRSSSRKLMRSMKVCLDCAHRFSGGDWRCPRCGFAPTTQDGHLLFAPEQSHQSEGFDETMFSRLASLEASSFWFRARNQLILFAITKFFSRARSILEIGCGTGFVLRAIHEAFPNANLKGSEVFSAGLDLAQQRLPNVELFQMDARRMPFESEFDLIGAFDVIEHIEADDLVLSQIHRSLHPGGGLLLTVPQHRWLWSNSDDFAHHYRRYGRRELIGKVRAAGFKVLGATSFVTLLLPLMALARVLQRGSLANYDPHADFVAGWKDKVLESVMSTELAMIRAGLAFPAGGSLLLAAEKA